MTSIYKEIQKLKDSPNTNTVFYKRFLARLNDRTPLTHEENPHSHFCCFTLPVDPVSTSIFLVHHIKADDWIPPGGHIDEDETPLQTINREFSEELGYTITAEPIALFDLSIKDIHNQKKSCKTHYDLWYSVETGKKQFKIDKGEFYDAGWFSYDQALRQVKTPLFKKILNNFFTINKLI